MCRCPSHQCASMNDGSISEIACTQCGYRYFCKWEGVEFVRSGHHPGCQSCFQSWGMYSPMFVREEQVFVHCPARVPPPPPPLSPPHCVTHEPPMHRPSSKGKGKKSKAKSTVQQLPTPPSPKFSQQTEASPKSELAKFEAEWENQTAMCEEPLVQHQERSPSAVAQHHEERLGTI